LGHFDAKPQLFAGFELFALKKMADTQGGTKAVKAVKIDPLTPKATGISKTKGYPMATKSGKTSVDESGLRFTSRENGSPFAGMGKMGETMSCIKCGMHKPRRQGSQQRFAGSLAFFCHDCKPPKPAASATPAAPKAS
jgi:hypothetical protein